MRVRFVDRLDVHGEIRPKNTAFGAVSGYVDGGQRVGGDHRAPPPNHVAVVVIVRRLDQDELEAPLGSL